MFPARLPLSDERRQRLRDDRLWIREMQRAVQCNAKKIHCPCTKCRGQKLRFIRNVREHLILNGRAPDCRIWRGSGNQDSSDEEWEQEFWEPGEAPAQQVDAQVDVEEMLRQAEAPHEHIEGPEERLRQEVSNAFAAADSMHEDSMQFHEDLGL